MSLSLLSPPSANPNPNPNPLTSLLAKYDTALSLYDDLARDISQMKKATQLVRAKTLKLFERKVRRKKAFGIQNEALDVLLAAGVKAQQRRRGTGPRKARPRRRDSTTTTASSSSSAKLGSPVKRRGSVGGSGSGNNVNVNVAPAVSLKVRFEIPAVPVRSVHTMSTRRSSKKVSLS